MLERGTGVGRLRTCRSLSSVIFTVILKCLYNHIVSLFLVGGRTYIGSEDGIQPPGLGL